MRKIVFATSVLIFFFFRGYTQNTYGLKDLLQLAEKNYPSIAAKKAQTQAAAAGISIQRNTIVPSFDAAYQTDYATYNNITGMAFPQYLIPISGPPSTTNNYTGVFGSAASLLLNWQPITFGLRKSQVNAAEQNYQLSVADENNTLFQLKLNVISTWLNIIYTDELLKVYQENIQRIQTQLKQITSLVKSGLRPGADTSLFQAELSKGNIDLYNLQLYRTQQKNNLAELAGVSQLNIITDSLLAKQLPQFNISDTVVIHPQIQYNEQLIQLQKANKTAIQKTVMPKLNVWSTGYARGSGIKYDGTVKSTDGFNLSRYNYGGGLQLSFPILQFTYTKLQVRQQDALIQNYQSQLQQVKLQLSTDSLNAVEGVNNALLIIKETPVQLNAATVAYKSTLSRYNAGLASFADLIQTQYALIQAETSVKQAYLNVWKALLQQAAASGDINNFLNQVK
jgi:outer membrane protein